MRSVLLRRLRLNALHARLWVGFVVVVLLTTLALLVGIDDYLDRRGLYQARRDADAEQDHAESIQTYAQTRVSFHRPPEPLSPLARGLGERFGSAVTVFGRFGAPRLSSRSSVNFLFRDAGEVDFAFVLMTVGSLLAVLLTADVLAGERRRGTLQLILSHGLARWKVLGGELGGAMLSLLIPMGVSLALALALLVWRGVAPLDASLLGHLLLFASVVMAAVSTFSLLGLWCSAASSEPETALVLGFLLWVLLAVIYPNGVAWVVRQGPRPGGEQLHPESLLTRVVGGGNPSDTAAEARQALEAFRNRNFEQAERIDSLWRLAPFSCVLLASQVVAATDREELGRYLATTRRLDQTLADWQAARIRRTPERERSYNASSDLRLDLGDLPRATFSPRPLGEVARALVPFWVGLLLWNLFLFAGLQITFYRYDVRAT